MLSFKRITRLFRNGARRGPVARRGHRVRLGIHELELRESPVALTFASPAAILGAAAVNGSASSAVRSLQSSQFGDVARRSSNFGFPASQAYAALNHSAVPNNRTIDITTSAYTTNFDTSSESIAKT